MSIAQSLLTEFDHEVATTRRVLERVSDAKFGWKPHAKSMSMGELANHCVNVPFWGTLTLSTDCFDISPGGKDISDPASPTAAELLSRFDKVVAEARATISGASDEIMLQQWSLYANGVTLFSMPRIAVMRTFVMNHLIHHRGQLSVYLRLNDISVPAIYGPSADEKLV